MKILFHYIHCPYCIRVRMALGFFNISYHSTVLPYDDEKTPSEFTGKKMLPILKWEDGSYQNESLDIIKNLDENKILNWELLDTHHDEIEKLLSELGSSIHSLCMPYWIYTMEFNESSRKYFQQKKEIKKGPFGEIFKKRNIYLDQLETTLNKIIPELNPYYRSEEFSILDIMLASHLWGMYIYPEFQFGPCLHQYLQDIKRKCQFDYHQDFQDFWK